MTSQTIPIEDLAEIQQIQAQMGAMHAQLGQLEQQAMAVEDARDAVRAQLRASMRQLGMANSALQKRHSLPEGARVDLADGTVTLP